MIFKYRRIRGGQIITKCPFKIKNNMKGETAFLGGNWCRKNCAYFRIKSIINRTVDCAHPNPPAGWFSKMMHGIKYDKN